MSHDEREVELLSLMMPVRFYIGKCNIVSSSDQSLAATGLLHEFGNRLVNSIL
jgi:hypothetical protein